MTNMLLEDILQILGRVGTVTLRKGTNDRSATAGHASDTCGWTCEITLSGYLRPYGHGGPGGSQLRLGSSGRGLTARDAAAATLAELETFLKSDESKHCRDCYVRDWEGRVRMAGPRTEDIPSHMSSRVRHPGKIAPEARIEYGD